MKANVNGIESIIRVLLGAGILIALFTQGESWGVNKWWGLVGLVPLITGSMRTCGLYALLGISTCKTKQS